MTSDTPTDEVPAKPKFGKQQIIATILTLLILVIVFAVVLPQLGDYDQAWAAIQDMEAWELGLIVAATTTLIIIYVFPFQAALPGLKYKPGFYTRQTSFMISNVIPGGGAWGLAVQYGMLASYGYGPAPATATIGITSVWNTLVTLTLPVVAMVALAATGEPSNQVVTVTLIAGVAVVVMIGLFAVVLSSEQLARKLGRLGNKIIQWGAKVIRKEVDFDAEEGVVHFRSSIIDVVKVRWLLITLANVGQQLMQFMILYLAVVALQGGFDGPVSIIEAFSAFAFGRMATFIPVPPGGLGTTDAIITASLTAFGMQNDDALAATLIWRAATYFPQVIIGAITMMLWQRSRPTKQSVAS